MKKINFKRIVQSRAAKRTVSGLTALALLLGTLPVGEIKTGVEKLGDLTLTAFAASDPAFEYTIDTTNGNHNIDIYPSQLVDYSKDCQAFPEYHQDDHILITTTGNEKMQVFNCGFVGIGTDDYPFSGTIEIGANNEDIVLNIDAPLFNAVYNDVTLTNNGGNFKIARAFDPEQTQISETNRKLSLLAEKVCFGTGSPATWNIEVVSPTDGEDRMLKDFSGFIGNIDSNTTLTVNVTMNGSGDDPGNLTIEGNGDTGLICGSMGEGSVLDFSLTTDRKINSVTTESGHVGGLVGSMQTGAVLNYNGTNIINDNADLKTTSNESYAGGLVGNNEGGTANIILPDGVTSYPVKQYIEGSAGAGGIFGYYKPGEPVETDNGDGTTTIVENSINIDKYDINCQVNGTGYDGGLFGVLETEYDYLITGKSLTSNHASGSADGYGGLIGRYANSDLTKTLSIGEVKATSSKGTAAYYGGGIAVIGDYIENSEVIGGSCYVKFDSFIANAAGANSMTFGGLVSIADNAFVDAKDVTVNITKNANRFKGGGVVGSLKSGVLRMSGITDLSNTYAEEFGFKGGQIVGYRDNALIFGTDDWQLKRGTVSYTDNNKTIYIKADDIGSWGEVLRFDGKDTSTEGQTSYGFGTDETVVTVNETDHYAKVAAPSYDSNVNISVGSVSDFAKASLNMQMNDGQSDDVLRFEETSYTSSSLLGMNITLTDDVSLKGTGLTGFTRDNAQTDSISADKCVYTGMLDGDGHSVTLAIGEPYGYRGDTELTDHLAEGNGKIYHHKYNGLFGIVDTSAEYVAKDLTIKGTADVSAYYQDKDHVSNAYVGGIAGRAKGDFKVDNITMTDTVTDDKHETAFTAYGGGHTYVGGLLGQVSTEIGDISITNSNVKCNIQTSNSNGDSCFAGLIGWIAYSGNESKNWDFTDVTVSGEINNTHARGTNKLGGIAAAITEYNGAGSQRAVNLTNVTIEGLTLKANGSDNSSMGGALGYTWHNVNTTFHNVEVKDSTIEMTSGNGALAGLVYQGTGYWKTEPYYITVTDEETSESTTTHYDGIKINGLTVTNSNARSFGMIVNSAKTGNTALYLEILADDTTNSTKAYNIASANLDELKDGCVFDEIAAYTFTDNVGKNGQAVISIHNDNFKTDGKTASGTYHAQTARGAVPNPNARYYYNLDTVKNETGSAALLMRWALHQYAHSSIQSNFTYGKDFSNSVIPDAIYDMKNYSWYPVDISGTVTVNGTFKFYNKEFEESEQIKANAETNSYKRTSMYDSTKNSFTQHKFMHAGLFRDVTGTLNVGNVTLQGNVGRIKNSSGDLESGVLACGWVKGSNANEMASLNITGGVTLDGLYVNGFNSTGTTDYAPLLVNYIREYTNTVIKGVKTSGYTDNIKVASSLIGDVGTTEATNITLTFKDMKLDGRTNSGAYSLDSVYGTKSAIFTRATFLNSFKYASGSSGSYDFNLADDWTDNSGTYSRASGQGVTYGSEISDSTDHNQYYGKEFWYKDKIGTIYTNYNQPTVSGTGVDANGDPIKPALVDFSGFLPYVYDVSTADNAATEKKYQIKVNHAVAQMTGCGTYNDPYIITSGDDLNNIAEILSGNANGKKIALPNVYVGTTNINFDKLKVKKWDDFGHSEFSYNGSNFVNGDSQTYSLVNVQTYLAGAYYKIESGKTIVLPSDFKGLGYAASGSEYSVFRGVIVGDGETITLTGKYPLIYASYGSVVKGININVNADVTLSQNQYAKFSYEQNGGNNSNSDKGVCYGAVMGRVLGGDNIIDGVTVSFGSSTIKLNSNEAGNYNVPIGGYIGVAEKGVVIFRGMEKYRTDALKSSIQGLTDSIVKDNSNNAITMSDKKYLFVNPIIGRTINAAIFTETSAYRPFEDGTRFGRTISNSGYNHYAEAVTMRNGTKNYSIPDITNNLPMFSTTEPVRGYKTSNNEGGFRTIDYFTLSVPNAQSLYIMSMVTQTGLGAVNYWERKGDVPKGTGGKMSYDNWGIAPYYGYRATHLAQYTDVGKGKSGDSAPTDGDYGLNVTKEVVHTINGAEYTVTNGVPYLVKNYTPMVNSEKPELGYIALCLTHQYSYMNIDFTGTDSIFYLPDGFRGLGTLGFNNNQKGSFGDVYQDEILHIYGMNGAGKTISLNMNYYSYEKDRDSQYMDTNVDYMGFGFMDAVMQNQKRATRPDSNGNLESIDPKNDNYKIHNFSLTGVVNYQIIDSGGNEIKTINSNQFNYYYSVGGLIGGVPYCQSYDIYKMSVHDIGLKDLTVNGVKNTGGVIGRVKSANNNESILLMSNIDNSNLSVGSGFYNGGLIGISENTAIEITDVTIAEPNIKTQIAFNSGEYNSNAIGGIIGYVKTGTENGQVYLYDITIGTNSPKDDYSAYIGYTEPSAYPTDVRYETIRAGGFIGRTDTVSTTMLTAETIDYSTKIENCRLYNVDVYGHNCGGVIGSAENNNTSIGVYDTVTENSGTYGIYGHRISRNQRGTGGIAGFINSIKKFTVNNCLVDGYTIKSNQRTGGIVGYTQASATEIDNTEVKDIKLISNHCVGGLVGYQNYPLNGYNIRTDNISFTPYTSGKNYSTGINTNGNSHGHIIGYRDKNASKTVKIAGFSRNNLSTSVDCASERMIGNSLDTDTSRYGTNGYVIFADYYNMTSTDNMSDKASTVNADDNVAQRTFKVDDQTADTANNFPYVNVSPKRAIESGDDGRFLTSDAVVSLTYDDSMFQKIIDDNKPSKIGSYTNYKTTTSNAPGTPTNITPDLATKVKAQFSTSAAQVPGSGAPNIPLIVIEDTDYKAVTQLLNSYINVLANTYGYNYAKDDTIHRVQLRKCSYDKSTGKYTIGADKSAALKKQNISNNDYFRMTAANVDNAVDGVFQFSLLDVQFLNPSNTDEVAYHLYIPVYVKKLLQYDYRAAMLSNTEYYPEAYGTLNGNSIFENLGNPVTMKFEYKYTRTADEWKDAINGGDNVLNNLYKTISVSGGVWPEGTRMVLVDANNKDKAYYLDSPGSGSTLSLYDFTDESEEHYKPAPLGNLMNITIGQPSDVSQRTLTPVTVDTSKSESEQIAYALEAGATVYSKGKFYRPINEDTDTELADEEKWAVTSVTNIQPERYYLSIFTPKSEDTKIYHYQFTGSESFIQRSTEDIYDGYSPNHITKTNAVVHLYIGDLYENTFTMTVSSKTGDREMSKSNNNLKVTMTSTVMLKSVATEIDDEDPSSAEYDKTRKGIAQNMRSNAATSEIYQAFLSTYDKKDTVDGSSNISINMQAPPFVIIKKYNYYNGEDKTGTANEISYPDPNEYTTENYVQLLNNKNIVSDLGNAANGYAITYELEYELNYFDENDLPAQFSLNAEKVDEVGTKVIGYSNISSSQTNVAYSATSEKDDTTSLRYYVSDSAQASLNYNVVHTTGEMSGPYSYLGINPLDEPETEHLIKTLAQYDTHSLKNSGDYIEFSLKLSKKSDYSEDLAIGTYIKSLKIRGTNNDLIFDSDTMANGSFKSFSGTKYLIVTRTDTEYKIRVHKDYVQKQGSDDSGRYLFPIEYTVYTGDEKFNNDGLMYSNYKVSVHAEMWSAITGGTESEPSNADNYLIYTNAKVDPDVIK